MANVSVVMETADDVKKAVEITFDVRGMDINWSRNGYFLWWGNEKVFMGAEGVYFCRTSTLVKSTDPMFMESLREAYLEWTAAVEEYHETKHERSEFRL